MIIKNLKKQLITLIILIFSSVFLTGITQAGERLNFIERFSIKMSSGLSYWTIGDINKHLVSGNEVHADYVQYFNGLKKGELEKIGVASNSEIELTFDITSHFRIYFCTGYVYTRKESSSGFEIYPRPRFLDVDFVDFTFSPRISISAIPLKIGLYCIIPFSPKVKLFINGGPGYYFAQTNFYWQQREIWKREDGSLAADFREMVEWDLNSKVIGFHGGIGFEFTIAKNFALVIEAQRRSAGIKKLKGTEIVVGDGYSESFYGSVYYYEKKDPITKKYYIGLGFYKEKPDYLPSPRYRNIRDVELDLSGYFLKIGIRIRLF